MRKTEHLLSMLMEMPPNFANIEKELQDNKYSVEEVTLAGYRFAENCFCECGDFEYNYGRTPKGEEVHSSYIYKICELLLKYGLAPNMLCGDCSDLTNIMYKLVYVDYAHIAAETMRLLLENGGSPDVVIDGETLFEFVDFTICHDSGSLYGTEFCDESFYDRQFRIWLLMIGYGAKINKEELPIKLVDGYSVENFKNFENFTYRIAHSEDDWIMHIIDKKKNIEVATL